MYITYHHTQGRIFWIEHKTRMEVIDWLHMKDVQRVNLHLLPWFEEELRREGLTQQQWLQLPTPWYRPEDSGKHYHH